MVNQIFTNLSVPERKVKLRTALRNKTRNALTESELQTIMENVDLGRQYVKGVAICRTDIGKVRSSNQDAVIDAFPLVGVADGMGGHRGGEVASSGARDVLVELLERNPETEDFVLHYPLNRKKVVAVDLSAYEGINGVPLFLQWDPQWGCLEYGGKCAALTGCGPVCLSMAAYYLTGDKAYSPDKMIGFAKKGGYYAPGSGSSWTLISEGGVELGFEVTELPLVKSRIFRELEAGWPIICAMGKGDFTTSGHFIVLTGVEDGLLRVNDPNSRANSEKLWKFEAIEGQFRNLWVIQK